MAHDVVCEKNLDTNDEYFVSLCQEEGGGGGNVLEGEVIPFYRFSF